MTNKKSRLFPAIQLLFLLLLASSILCAPDRACFYAGLALQLWFDKMIPSLFPFMILSGLIVRLDFGRYLSVPVYPLLGNLYQINRRMCTTLLTGFLFGFPLGAKTVAEQYSLGQLSKSQAQYLLSFCNNIGPVYLLGFALPLLGLSGDVSNPPLKTAVAALFFGIPLLYGLALRHTLYRRTNLSAQASSPRYLPALPPEAASRTGVRRNSATNRSVWQNVKSPSHKAGTKAPALLAAAYAETKNAPPDSGNSALSFLPALDASITSACAAITRLGGYMIFFIVCNLLTEQAAALVKNSAAKTLAALLAALAAPILEITSGLSLSEGALPPAVLMTLITFGGLSCFAQTYTCIRDTDLSFGNYCLHKLLQSIIAFCLYALLFSAFSGRQLS